MASTELDTDSALERAYNELSAADRPVTVQALRARAKVAQNTAATWLKARRAAQRPPSPVPDDVTTAMVEVLREQIVEPIWNRCAGLAEAQQKQAYADELLATHDALESARETAQNAETRLATAQSKIERLTEQLATAEAALADLRAFRDRWATEAETARAVAAEAKRLADQETAGRMKAEAQVDALREVLATLQPPEVSS